MSTAEKIYVALVENPGEQSILAERYRIRAWTADPERARLFRESEGIDTVAYIRADLAGGPGDIEADAQNLVVNFSGHEAASNASSIALMSAAVSLKRIADALTYQSAGGENLYDMIRSISQGGNGK